MRVIPPLEITAARMTSSTAAEPGVGEADYNPATAYAIGDRVILGAPTSSVTITVASPAVVTWATHGQPEGTPVVLTTSGALPTGLTAGVVYYVLRPATGTFQLSATPGGAPIVTTGTQSGTHTATTFIHRVYESLIGTNTGNYPALASSDGKWLDVGPTNRWAMFDLLRNTATTAESPLTVEITPGIRVDSIGLVGLVADSVTVEVSVLGVPVYTETRSLLTREVTTWYAYFFTPFATAPSLALFDLPPVTNGVVTVTITRATGMASCGGLVLGQSVYLGQTQYDADSDALNFSRVERDEFGETASMIPRRSVPKVNARVMCAKANVNRVRDLRTELNAVPALWSGLDDPTDGYFEAVLILGFYKQFSINLSYPEHAVISLELEEV